MTAIDRCNEADLLAGVMQYPRLLLVRGEGSYVWDAEGRRYLDFTAGLAVAALGHGRADLADVLREQFATLAHCSNLYGNVPALRLAERLLRSSFASRVWFANSGAEANEAALKFARLHGTATGGPRKTEIVAFRGGFHGRTLGALSATYNPHYRKPFMPLLPGCRFADFNDLESAAKQISARTAAVIVEPVQGEGGVLPASPGFLPGLRALCDQHGALLILDEIQCGLGRLGRVYAYQEFEVVPDLVTLAKPLAGGLPLGAILVGPRVAPYLKPGHHGTTFGGGPAVCAVAGRVFDLISAPDFLASVRARAERLHDGLQQLAAESRAVRLARGRGLMQALVLAPAWRKRLTAIVQAARGHGLLVTRAGTDAVRLLPPLTCSDAEVDEALQLLAGVLQEAAPGRRSRKLAAGAAR